MSKCESKADGVLVRTYGEFEIAQRPTDGYFNATAMCKASRKLWADYQRLASTSAYLDELSADMGIPISELVEVRKGGVVGELGTWVHPDVAIHLAQWCSPKFAVQVSKWVRELLTAGSVTLDPTAEAEKRVVQLTAHFAARCKLAIEMQGQVPYGYWSVMAEGVGHMNVALRLIAYSGLPIVPEDLLDGSVGTMWAKEFDDRRTESGWSPSAEFDYTFPDGSARAGLTVTVRCYPDAAMSHFRRWMQCDYLTSHFPAYVRRKYNKDGLAQLMEHAPRHLPKLAHAHQQLAS